MIYKEFKNKKRMVYKVFAYTFLLLGSITMLLPFIYTFFSTFKGPVEIFEFNWLPKNFTLENYKRVFKETTIIRAFFNTMFYIIPPITVGVLTSSMAAYAFARLDFRGKNTIFFMMISTMVIPAISILIPSYILFVNFYGWGGTPLPLIIPGMFGAVLTTFYLRQFMKALPVELEEAALIDGMSRGGIFFKIILPLSKPALVTQVILSFNGAYNDYLGPLMYVGTDRDLYTVQLVIASLNTPLHQEYNMLITASIIAVIPTLILFIFAQRYFVEGIAFSGMKE